MQMVFACICSICNFCTRRDPNGLTKKSIRFKNDVCVFKEKRENRYEYPYYNYLQTPLQPLMDNLESQTYEVFEQDPVK